MEIHAEKIHAEQIHTEQRQLVIIVAAIHFVKQIVTVSCAGDSFLETVNSRPQVFQIPVAIEGSLIRPFHLT